ncbi:MAG: potassium transporter Kup [Acidobacteria bacterium]|nr:potassium transporter Kup [Acidobacteriota bacterium]MCA1609656.1 potassium transporter Kup [Acidobacteriota bacterium]
MEDGPASDGARGGKYLFTLSLGALGIVYGDIGTSPLYALRECFHGPHAIPPTPANVMGVLSLVFWSLLIVISIKYLVFVMRADNRGEGGILALMSLIRPHRKGSRGFRFALTMLGLFGAALLYGDGIITPAISVLSAVEGLEIATPVFAHLVQPITILILIGLFLIQKRGTQGVGAIFGPVMIVWFISIAALGFLQIIREPGVLASVNPLYAVHFFRENTVHGFLALGTVFLVVTGGEALYADMGHFGARPIRLAWFVFVLPALLLNYMGQGALLLTQPSAAANPFYRLGPAWTLYPMVVLSTIATVIASQAVISGAFSLTRQAVLLGYSPRVQIDHTSAREIGQIYIPSVNWALMLATIALVVGFGSSSNLAAAYGVAVTTTMAITTMLMAVVAHELWGWSIPASLLLAGVFLVPDLAFFGANIVKVPHGGWFPLLVAAGIFIMMTTWRRGREILNARLIEEALPLEAFISDFGRVYRVQGTGVYMSRTENGVPPALLHNFKHNKVLHKTVALLTVITEDRPHVPESERLAVSDLGNGLFRVVARHGFMEDASVLELLGRVEQSGLEFPPGDTSFFLGKETIFASKRPGMAIWRERLFALMSRNARSATLFFRLPPNRVVELGAQIEI